MAIQPLLIGLDTGRTAVQEGSKLSSSYILKGYSSPKTENSVIIYSAFLLFSTKEGILKNVCNQTVAGSHWLQ